VLCDFSDRETAEAVRFDVRWKVAIGAPLDDAGFDPSSLVYWRNRIAKSARPHRVNDAVRKVIEQTGVLGGRRRRAVDSTILADAVSTQDTVTQLVSAIRRVAREVPGAAEQIAAVCTGKTSSCASRGHAATLPACPALNALPNWPGASLAPPTPAAVPFCRLARPARPGRRSARPGRPGSPSAT
jgi:hypothetical protein